MQWKYSYFNLDILVSSSLHTHNRQLLLVICKQIIIKLVFVMFSGNVYDWSKFKTHWRNIFFSWTFDLFCFVWSLISRYIKKILYVNTYSKWWKKKQRYTFSNVSDADVKESCFLMWSWKFLINDFWFFSLSLTYFLNKLKSNHGLYKTDLFYIQSVLYRLWSKLTAFPYMPQQRCEPRH